MSKSKSYSCIKICLMGCTNVGKTALINRLINKNFSKVYEPTMKLETYSFLFNLNDENVVQKTYVNLIIQDTFGLNNSILNKPPELIVSKNIKKQREKMTKEFKEIMFSSTEMRNKLMSVDKNQQKMDINFEEELLMDNIGYESDNIPRSGFIFVCDCENLKSFESIEKIIEKLQEVEKSNNLKYPKMILFNKSDRLNEEEFREYVQRKATVLESFKGRSKIDIFRVSALTGHGVEDAFKMFVTRIHQEQQNQKQNDGISEPEENSSNRWNPSCEDSMASFSKKMFCGKNIFSCGVYYYFYIF